MPTHTSKFQDFLKLKCCICCSIYIFLNHLIRVKMWYLLSSYLYVSSTKFLSIVPQSLFPHKPCDFHCAILYSTVIFRNTSHYRIDYTWLFYPRIEPILQDQYHQYYHVYLIVSYRLQRINIYWLMVFKKTQKYSTESLK